MDDGTLQLVDINGPGGGFMLINANHNAKKIVSYKSVTAFTGFPEQTGRNMMTFAVRVNEISKNRCKLDIFNIAAGNVWLLKGFPGYLLSVRRNFHLMIDRLERELTIINATIMHARTSAEKKRSSGMDRFPAEYMKKDTKAQMNRPKR